MRGTLAFSGNSSPRFGIIPAHAGNTGTRNIFYKHRGDHPRACGEHTVFAQTHFQPPGSSPRMRGTPRTITILTLPVGIIPAHAGNTRYRMQLPERHGDHPRACGEHADNSSMTFNSEGSSPRMRGTQKNGTLRTFRRWIIPAHAGNTECSRRSRTSPRDHPRACGEHVTIPEDALLTAGSSPRMRGTLVASTPALSHLGIIPAHAGNTQRFLIQSPMTRDHPRACGEH